MHCIWFRSTKKSTNLIHQQRYVALVDSSAWPFQGERRELVFEQRENALLSGRPFVFQHQPFFGWIALLWETVLFPTASILSNTIERNLDCYFVVVVFFLKCSCLAWFQIFSLFLPTLCCIRKQASPHAVCVVFMVPVMFTAFGLYGWSLFGLGRTRLSDFQIKMGSVSMCGTCGLESGRLKFTAVVWIFVFPSPLESWGIE